MQVGRVSRQTPVAPHLGTSSETRSAAWRTSKEDARRRGDVPALPAETGQQLKRPRRRRRQPLSPHARLAPRGRSAPCCASRYLPSPLTRQSPEETQRAEGRAHTRSKTRISRGVKDTHERSAAVAASGRRKETKSAQDFGWAHCWGSNLEGFLKTQHLDSALQMICLFLFLYTATLSLTGRDRGCLTAER